MAKMIPLAPDSVGFKVLLRLRELGGKATIGDLLLVLWKESRELEYFKQTALGPLLDRRFVTTKGRFISMTAEGALYLEHHIKTTAAPRVTENMASTLNLQKHIRPIVGRPGAFDYRNIPSLMGGKRVPYYVQSTHSAAGGEELNG